MVLCWWVSRDTECTERKASVVDAGPGSGPGPCLLLVRPWWLLPKDGLLVVNELERPRAMIWPAEIEKTGR